MVQIRTSYVNMYKNKLVFLLNIVWFDNLKFCFNMCSSSFSSYVPLSSWLHYWKVNFADGDGRWQMVVVDGGECGQTMVMDGCSWQWRRMVVGGGWWLSVVANGGQWGRWTRANGGGHGGSWWRPTMVVDGGLQRRMLDKGNGKSKGLVQIKKKVVGKNKIEREKFEMKSN